MGVVGSACFPLLSEVKRTRSPAPGQVLLSCWPGAASGGCCCRYALTVSPRQQHPVAMAASSRGEQTLMTLLTSSWRLPGIIQSCENCEMLDTNSPQFGTVVNRRG